MYNCSIRLIYEFLLEKQTLPASTLLASLRQINQFISGGKYSTLKQHIKSYDLPCFKRDFYAVSIYSGKDYEQHASNQSHEASAVIFELETLLTQLSIPRARWGLYLNTHFSLYEILCQLNADLQHNSTIQLNSVLELVEAKTAWNKRVFWVVGGSVALLLVGSPALAGLVELGKVVMASVIAIPMLGALYNLGSSAYFAYLTHFDKKRPLFNRLRDNFFLLLNNIFNISGSIVWLVSGAVVAPIPSAALFLCASLVNVVKEVFSMAQNFFEYKKHAPFLGQNLHDQKEYTRHQLGYRQHRNAAMINIATAVVVLALMAVCLFVPGGIFVTIAALLAMGVAYKLNEMALKKNHSIIREQLQEELSRLGQEDEAKKEQQLSSSYSYSWEAEDCLEQESQSDSGYDNEAIPLSVAAPPITLEEQNVKSKRFSYAHACGLSFFGIGSGEKKEKIPTSQDSLALGAVP